MMKRNFEILMRMKVKRHARLPCHSGSCPRFVEDQSGIFLFFQKDSRLPKAFGIAGMTKYEALLMHSLVGYRKCSRP
jgi:hypothetical protein